MRGDSMCGELAPAGAGGAGSSFLTALTGHMLFRRLRLTAHMKAEAKDKEKNRKDLLRVRGACSCRHGWCGELAPDGSD